MMSDRYMSQEALDRIIEDLYILPDEISHHAANILDDEEGTEYCRAAVDALTAAAARIRVMAGLEIA
jgi:hypothetical protein